MGKPSTPIVLLFALLVVACTVGSGNVVAESRPVAGFDAVALATSGEVIIDVTGTESLEIEAEDNILSLLTTIVTDGRLELSSDGAFATTEGVTYRITVAEISDVTVSGSGNVAVRSLETDDFRVTITGSGNVEPIGSVADLEVTISGSGSFQGESLQAVRAIVAISGSGSAVVNATDDLVAQVTGSGNIEYVGDPTVREEISGSGEVSRR